MNVGLASSSRDGCSLKCSLSQDEYTEYSSSVIALGITAAPSLHPSVNRTIPKSRGAMYRVSISSTVLHIYLSSEHRIAHQPSLPSTLGPESSALHG